MENMVCNRCGSIDDFRKEKAGIHVKAICNGCDSYIKMIPQNGPAKFYIGKYKGTMISKCDDKNYLTWFLENTDPKKKIKKAIEHRIKELS